MGAWRRNLRGTAWKISEFKASSSESRKRRNEASWPRVIGLLVQRWKKSMSASDRAHRLGRRKPTCRRALASWPCATSRARPATAGTRRSRGSDRLHRGAAQAGQGRKNEAGALGSRQCNGGCQGVSFTPSAKSAAAAAWRHRAGMAGRARRRACFCLHAAVVFRRTAARRLLPSIVSAFAASPDPALIGEHYRDRRRR